MRPPAILLGLAAVLLLGGGALFLRTLARLVRTIRARYTYGAPYREGQIGDRLLGFVMTWPLPALGCACAFLALAQAAFQPIGGVDPVRVGRLDAKRAAWGRTAVRLEPDAAYPSTRGLEGEIEGARWAVEGAFIDWDPGVRWLGLVPGHRVRALLGTRDPSGTSPNKALRTTLDVLPRASEQLLRHAGWLPFLKVRRGTSEWYPPAERRLLILYATPEGYVANFIAEAGG
ncbi:MAG TPA: hypothetical protein VFD06_15235 [Candidatus Polarisedimenticolia bacterium]|nr:hypothetical protein [Candidatus Polarisedimenticolia bacterium]